LSQAGASPGSVGICPDIGLQPGKARQQIAQLGKLFGVRIGQCIPANTTTSGVSFYVDGLLSGRSILASSGNESGAAPRYRL